MQPSHQTRQAGPIIISYGTSTSLSPSATFPLLSLPREIRDCIYRHALLAPGQTPISCARSKPFFKNLSTLPPAALLVLANRQVHAEASLVLYGENVFDFASTDWFYAWYQTIGAAHQPLVRRLLISPRDALGYFFWAKALRGSGLTGLCEIYAVGSLGLKAYRDRYWAERTFDMLTDTFEEERRNAHLVEFGEREGIERKMYLMGYDEVELKIFLACRAGWPVDASDEQVEALDTWYEYVLKELAKRYHDDNAQILEARNLPAPWRRRKLLALLWTSLLLMGLAVGIWALHRYI